MAKKKNSPVKKVITNQTPKEVLKETIIDGTGEEPAPKDTSVTRSPVTTPPSESTPEQEPDSENPQKDEESEVDQSEGEEPEGEEPEGEESEEPVETPKKEPKEPDWKSRYVGSTREAQVLAARNKEFAETVERANSLPEPTDEEMKKEYGDNWDIMDDIQRKIAKESALSKKRFAMLQEIAEKSKKVEEWTKKTKEFVEDPQITVKYPQLLGKEAEFIQFCSLPTRVGVDLDDLVRAFSFDIKGETPKRKTLFQPAGGGKSATPAKELSIEEISFLRTHNQKEYKRLIQSGKIKIEI